MDYIEYIEYTVSTEALKEVKRIVNMSPLVLDNLAEKDYNDYKLHNHIQLDNWDGCTSYCINELCKNEELKSIIEKVCENEDIPVEIIFNDGKSRERDISIEIKAINIDICEGWILYTNCDGVVIYREED